MEDYKPCSESNGQSYLSKKMEQQLRDLYRRTWAAMITKDEKALNELHANSFVLVHMTGTRQSKPVYIRSILNGTLNYYSEKTERIDIRLTDDTHADVTGYSEVNAAVYGGSRHMWHLLMQFKAIQENGQWRFSHCDVSVY